MSGELSGPMHDYLAAMVELSEEGKKIRAAEIARRLGVKKPSVCNAIQVLKDHGMITADGGRNIALTEKGITAGREEQEKEDFFRSILLDAGLEESLAAGEARQIAHAISDDTYEALRGYLEPSKSAESAQKK
jgi:Mn-dependent DtxR family transcriptional regulator